MNKKVAYTIITISAIFIVATYSVYFYHFHNGFSGQSTEWSNYGSFINSLSPILAFLNILLLIITVSKQLEELTKQRESLYYPNIAICGIPFIAKTDLEYIFADSVKYPILWTINHKTPTYYCNSNEELIIKMFNIGMGAAQNISIEWIVDYKNVFQMINKKCKTEKFKIIDDKFTLTDGIVKTTYESNSKYTYHFDFIIQSKSKDDFLGFEIPEVIRAIHSQYFQEMKNNKIDFDSLSDDEMISVKIDITYFDITGKKYNKLYNANFYVFGLTSIDHNNYEIDGDIKINELFIK